jgi:hypothetical protein
MKTKIEARFFWDAAACRRLLRLKGSDHSLTEALPCSMQNDPPRTVL